MDWDRCLVWRDFEEEERGVIGSSRGMYLVKVKVVEVLRGVSGRTEVHLVGTRQELKTPMLLRHSWTFQGGLSLYRDAKGDNLNLTDTAGKSAGMEYPSTRVQDRCGIFFIVVNK